MDNTIMRTMLFDFYGDLLTEKQREYYDLHYNSDLSLQEIAEQSGVSRQAVWDIIRRAEQSMSELEDKTGLVARAVRRRKAVEELQELISALPEGEQKAAMLAKTQELND
ncbi:MAG: YlxM family DNA-binding protein [Oscillospiraceae bacterium]|nr:YlxM family DNA-binding protein [Oscillospiraceae bacterium]